MSRFGEDAIAPDTEAAGMNSRVSKVSAYGSVVVEEELTSQTAESVMSEVVAALDTRHCAGREREKSKIRFDQAGEERKRLMQVE